MGKPSVPNPQQVASAQAGSNISTAIANTVMGNANTYGPLGSTVYNQIGTKGVRVGGRLIQVPQYKVTNSLSDDQQKLLNRQETAGIHLGDTAVKESIFLRDYLGKPFDPGTLPDQVTNAPNAPHLQNANGIDTPNLQNDYNDARWLFQKDYNQGGPIQNQFDTRQSFINYGYDNGGKIQQDITGGQDYGQQRDEVVKALMGRINPQLQQQQSALDQRLANQGISLGSEAWKRAQTQQGQTANDAFMQAILAGGQEQSRLAGLDLAQGQFHNQAQGQQNAQNAAEAQFRNAAQQQFYNQNLGQAQFANQAQGQRNQENAALAQFQNAAQQQLYGQNQGQAQFYNQASQQDYQNLMNQLGYNNQVAGQNFDLSNQEAQMQQTLRQQAYQEAMSMRNQPLSEVNQLLNGAQPTIPQFQQFQAGHVSDVPVGQYIYQSAAMQNQANNAAMGGLFGLGSSFLGALPFLGSDRKLKEKIKKVGKLDNGLPVYSFNYKGDDVPRMGLMADDVKKVHPEAVMKINGFDHVHYGLAVQ